MNRTIVCETVLFEVVMNDSCSLAQDADQDGTLGELDICESMKCVGLGHFVDTAAETREIFLAIKQVVLMLGDDDSQVNISGSGSGRGRGSDSDSGNSNDHLGNTAAGNQQQQHARTKLLDNTTKMHDAVTAMAIAQAQVRARTPINFNSFLAFQPRLNDL